MASFTELGLSESLAEGLKKSAITVPTPIQEKVIPMALQNKDMTGQAETGSGKTLAYLLPLFQKINPEGGTQALILAPTHELASQIRDVAELLAKNSGVPVTSMLIIGEVNITRQIERLKKKPNIIIGSAGRILELIEKKKINAQTIKTLIIDEADRMLDVKNFATVKKVVKTTQKDRQVMLFSASISEKTREIAAEILREPEIIKAETKQNVPSAIKHLYISCEYEKKLDNLRRIIGFLKPEKSLIFIRQSDNMDRYTKETKYFGLKAGGLAGSQEKEERKKVMDDFRKGKIQILFATDIASRGLDIKGVTHVFNFDVPSDPKTYLHRCGRTGRQGTEGFAISVIAPDEKELLFRIAKSLNITLEHLDNK